MGTLTANQVRLPEHCEHKLPTSCRLTSLPNCCACADERAHAPSYSTYIDGIGFVPRGNRWQRYCWYCKEFWENRVGVSGLRPSQTRIPQVPDQTEFLQRWYEFHRGYRIVQSSDDREERIAVLGEDFKDVSPGTLPRTLEEMRAGRQAEDVAQSAVQIATVAEVETGPTLEETLDQMFADAANEEPSQPATAPTSTAQPMPQPSVEISRPSNIHAQAMNPPPTRSREYQMRRVAALRRELLRMRSGIERVISGLRDLGEDIPTDDGSIDTVRRLDAILDTPSTNDPQPSNSNTNSAANRALLNLEGRMTEARTRFDAASQARSRAAADLEAAEVEFRLSSQQVQQVQREQRTMENYTRVFGTREEMIAQGENYESPVGSLFSRAYERFRAAEDVRREQRTLRQVLEDEERIDTNEAVSRRLEELESRERDVWGVPRSIPPQQSPLVHLPSGYPGDQTGHARNHTPEVNTRANETSPLLNESDQAGGRDDALPPVLADTNDEAMLQEYYSLIRQQERSQLASSDGIDTLPQGETAFPQSMLNTVMAARARDAAEQQADPMLPEDYRRSTALMDAADDARVRFSMDEWWHEDAGIIIRALTTDESLREELGISIQDAAILQAYFADDLVSESDRITIDSLLRNPTAIWGAGLPAEWLGRRRPLLSTGIFFRGSGGSAGNEDWAGHHNPYIRLELFAQAFMMSAEIRRRATNLSSPERLQMLYRLQSGRRTEQDVAVLGEMNNDDFTYHRSFAVYRQNILGEDEAEAEQVNETRRRMAREGDHSREELEARRNELSTRAFALAAGRQAFQTGSQALIEQMAAANNPSRETDLEAGTRAAFQRLQTYGLTNPGTRERTERRTTLYRQLTLSDYLDSSPGTSRSSSPESQRGLDARDTGRPEPKSDQELQVSMECQVCYTQMADIACLPCGHLVMCKWCSEQHSPCLNHDRTRPRRPIGCPVCRRTVRQKVRVFRA